MAQLLIKPNQGGTGVDNGPRTLTISTNSGTVAFPASAKTYTMPADTTTLLSTDLAQNMSNKRRKLRVYTATNNATLTPEIDTYDLFKLTAMTASTTLTNHITSTPDDGDMIMIWYKDNGTARTISHGTNYVAGKAALLTTTVVGKRSWEFYQWDAATSKYVCLDSGTEA